VHFFIENPSESASNGVERPLVQWAEQKARWTKGEKEKIGHRAAPNAPEGRFRPQGGAF
jgi:hypothetical protein